MVTYLKKLEHITKDHKVMHTNYCFKLKGVTILLMYSFLVKTTVKGLLGQTFVANEAFMGKLLWCFMFKILKQCHYTNFLYINKNHGKTFTLLLKTTIFLHLW